MASTVQVTMDQLSSVVGQVHRAATDTATLGKTEDAFKRCMDEIRRLRGTTRELTQQVEKLTAENTTQKEQIQQKDDAKKLVDKELASEKAKSGKLSEELDKIQALYQQLQAAHQAMLSGNRSLDTLIRDVDVLLASK